MKLLRILVFLVACLFLVNGFTGLSLADSESDRLNELSSKISEYEAKITQLQTQSNTLANQIAQYDAQITLTELKIDQTNEQINLLGGRIDQLEVSLGDLESAFNNRALETYKMSRTSGQAYYLISSEGLSEAMSRLHYLQRIQEADRSLLTRLQSAKDAYIEQKDDLEKLERVLGAQKKELDSQKVAKNQLLIQTKNDEETYQDLLAQAKAEYEAIQAIISGRGDEGEAVDVNKGERIASVIAGASCNSSGSHLHFMVASGGNTQNPFNYLKPIEHENCTGGGECSAADPFNPSGSWDWPISAPIRYSQGYGSTWATQNTWVGRIYSFHNGIDINSNNSEVRAVSSGKLYRGSYSGYQGCRLKYVRVDHSDSDLETYYLHVNY